MSNRKKKLLLVLLVFLVMCFGSLAGYSFSKNFEEKSKVDIDKETISQSTRDAIYYEGKEYRYNRKLINILFMGIDKQGKVKLSDTPGTGGQADVVILISLDKENKTARLLQVSRDTMTDIDIYQWNGDYYTTVKGQLALQYAYGNGTDTSCWAMKKTVSELLYDLPIDGYLAMNIEGISVVNDAVGGVSLTMPEDFTYIDSMFVKGETVVLNGNQAERYVRYRDTTIIGSNSMRMVRQTQYISALLEAMYDKASEYEDSYQELFALVEPYIVTDMTFDQITELAGYHFFEDQIVFAPGEEKAGEQHDEFYVNEKEMKELLLKLFYKQK